MLRDCYRTPLFCRDSNMAQIIAHQGVPGAYSHQAALQYFGQDASLTAYDTFADTLIAVEQGQAYFAVFPIENSIAGVVQPNADLLAQHPLVTHDAFWLPIAHYLLVLPGKTMDDIDTVISHPQGLKQCSQFLSRFPWAQQPFSNTAAAAKAVAETPLPTSAAIASQHAAEYYGLAVLADHIADQDDNQSRFLVLTRA